MTVSIAFVFTNPKHHLEMMAPVAAELRSRGIACDLLSLAELRGLETPAGARRVIPLNLRKRRGQPALASEHAVGWSRGSIAKRAVWSLVLAPAMRVLLRHARVVVVPNDAVYPYSELVAAMRARGVATVLMQEGIRFPLPDGYRGPQYGAAVDVVCAWGEGSRDYFVASGVAPRVIEVTGAPRLDTLDPGAWRDGAAALLARHKLATAPLAFLSNPIEIQGYGDKRIKLDLFARVLAEAAPLLRARGIPVLVKNHAHEDPADFRRVADASPIADLVTLAPEASIFAAIAASRAAIVLTSTVGLESLVFDRPIGVLEIPGHGYAFEYVQQGAATPLRHDALARDIEQLLAPPAERRTAGEAFIRRHLHDRGRARYHVAAVLERALARHT
ncbi:MAG TPA: hypothetical protein VH914_17250 [Acidimicrobiia bacterium]|jgi:hypothetical protein|nr:hypothetical protein [Acidimicrobiia bacterium]